MFAVLSFWAAGTLHAQTGSLILDVVHPAAESADVRVALYTTAENWLEDPVYTAIEPATDTLTVVTFTDLATGIYGAAVFLDENRNGELDRNLIGWFKEPFAFSKEARVRFGPPKWEDAVFDVTHEPLRLNLRME